MSLHPNHQDTPQPQSSTPPGEGQEEGATADHTEEFPEGHPSIPG